MTIKLMKMQKVSMAEALLVHNDTSEGLSLCAMEAADRSPLANYEEDTDLMHTTFRFADGSVLFVDTGQGPTGVAFPSLAETPRVRELTDLAQ